MILHADQAPLSGRQVSRAPQEPQPLPSLLVHRIAVARAGHAEFFEEQDRVGGVCVDLVLDHLSHEIVRAKADDELRYAGTVEDTVYAALSTRMGDIFAVVGQLPDGFEDAWVEAVLKDREAVRHFPQRFTSMKPPMELRYARDVADDRGLDWESTTRVIADRDLDDFLRVPW